MCVGCSRGFEIVDLESLDTQGLLDPNDGWNFCKEDSGPMVIYWSFYFVVMVSFLFFLLSFEFWVVHVQS